MGAGSKRRRYITFKVEDDLPGVARLRSAGPRVREPLRERCARCCRFCGFCLVCTGTLFQTLAPWALPVIELATLLLLLLLLLLPAHPPGPYLFSYTSSLEDLVVLSGLRAAAICGTYAAGTKRLRLTPYLYTSYALGAAGLAYVVPKAVVFVYPLAWLPSAAMLLTFACFSWIHILAARYTVSWFRRRSQLGLAPFAPTLGLGLRHSASAGSLAGSAAAWGLAEDESGDLPAELLAEPDSQFVDVDGLVVHYKEAYPSEAFNSAWLAAYTPAPLVHINHSLRSLSGSAAGSGEAPPLPQQPPQPQQQGGAADGGLHAAGSQGGSVAAAAAPAAAGAAAQPEIVAAAAGTPAEPAPGSPSPPASPGAASSGLLAAGDDTAVVLVHGFGGGVFAWRHLLEPLAAAVGVRVIAFDRPGFGLTARPDVQEPPGGACSGDAAQPASWQSQCWHACCGRGGGSQLQQPLLPTTLQPPAQQQQPSQQRGQAAGLGSNPYSLESQALLTLRFCKTLGVKRVLLVGHADGCLVAVHAAALACTLRRQVQLARQAQQQAAAAAQQQGEGQAPRAPTVAVPLQTAGSVDFSWMGSMSEDPTPRMIAHAAQAVLLQQQQQQQLPGGCAGAGEAAAEGAGRPAATGSPLAGVEPQQQQQLLLQQQPQPHQQLQQQQQQHQHQQPPAINRALEAVRTVSEGEAGDGSPASSISFHSMLAAASAGGSRQQLSELGSECGGGGVPSGPGSECGDAPGQHSVACSGAGGSAGGSAGGGSQLQTWGSLVLKPPQPQPPMIGRQWDELAAAAGSAAGLPPMPPLPPHAPGAQAGGGAGGARPGAGAVAAAAGGVHVAGLALLHPNLSGHQVPSFTRLLAGSSLGRSMLRPLLRSEVGEVSNRRSWHNPELLTRDVLALYKRPLRVRGWDAALLATSRATGSISSRTVAAQFAAVRALPVLLVTGAHDRIASPAKVAGVAALLPRARRVVLPACGHLSHEEAPQALLEQLVPFCRERLTPPPPSGRRAPARGAGLGP